MALIGIKNSAGSQAATRPPAAVEVAPEGVLGAVRSGHGEPLKFALAPLREGALVAGVEQVNLRIADAVTEAIGSALDHLSPRTRAVTLVLPDTAVRVFILDFDTLPSKTAEAVPVIRFRLRKMVPFDVEKAGISYQVLTESDSECRVLVAVLPGPILEEYEAAVRAAGYEPGAVLPSSLAAMAAIDSDEPVLAACLSSASLTTAITQGQDLLLYRTLELPEDAAQRLSEVQRDIAVAVAYYEDKLSRPPREIRYGGPGTADQFARWVQVNDPQVTVRDLAPRPATGATALGKVSLAGITGALSGVA